MKKITILSILFAVCVVMYQSRQLGQQLWNHYNEMYNLAELQYDGGVASTTTTMIKTEEYGNIELKLYVYAAEIFIPFTLS